MTILLGEPKVWLYVGFCAFWVIKSFLLKLEIFPLILFYIPFHELDWNSLPNCVLSSPLSGRASGFCCQRLSSTRSGCHRFELASLAEIVWRKPLNLTFQSRTPIQRTSTVRQFQISYDNSISFRTVTCKRQPSSPLRFGRLEKETRTNWTKTARNLL